jgi:hypothetical protein
MLKHARFRSGQMPDWSPIGVQGRWRGKKTPGGQMQMVHIFLPLILRSADRVRTTGCTAAILACSRWVTSVPAAISFPVINRPREPAYLRQWSVSPACAHSNQSQMQAMRRGRDEPGREVFAEVVCGYKYSMSPCADRRAASPPVRRADALFCQRPVCWKGALLWPPSWQADIPRERHVRTAAFP